MNWLIFLIPWANYVIFLMSRIIFLSLFLNALSMQALSFPVQLHSGAVDF